MNIREQVITTCNTLPEHSLEKVMEFIQNHLFVPLHDEEADDTFYSRENVARLKRSIANLEAGGGTYHELIEVDDA